jgi:hypothetical protein
VLVLPRLVTMANRPPSDIRLVLARLVAMANIPSSDLWAHWIQDDVIGLVGFDLVEAWYTMEHTLRAVLGRSRRH